MNAASFEDEPQASATAVQLREHGFDSEVVTFTDKTYDERMP